MQDTLLKEKHFEEAIEKHLIEKGGYAKGSFDDFNRATALDEQTFIKFIQTTQSKAWEKHCKNYPTNPEQALLKRFQDEVASTNLLWVLRHGFKDRGVQFKVCYFKPESSLNPETIEKYNQNILHCTRQMKFSLKSDIAGEFDVEIPRDRNGEYEPKLVKKYQNDVSSIDDKILSMYAKGNEH